MHDSDSSQALCFWVIVIESTECEWDNFVRKKEFLGFVFIGLRAISFTSSAFVE